MNYAPEPIGVGRYVGELGAFLEASGDDVHVVTAPPHYPGWYVRPGYRNRYSTEQQGRMIVHRCPLLLRTQMRGIWRMLAPLSFALTSAPIALWHILVRRPDTVLCVEPTLLSAPIAVLAAKLVGARIVLNVQDLEVDAAFSLNRSLSPRLQPAIMWLEKHLLRAFDCIVTISDAMSRKLRDKDVCSQRLTVIRNWIDPTKIYPLSRPSIYRRNLSIDEDRFVVQYAGNIGAKQALHHVLAAAERLTDLADVLFVIAGEGPEKKRLMEQYGHLPNVMFLGLQPEQQLCEFLALANLHIIPQDAGAADLVLPSKLGGMVASGKPVMVMAAPDTELATFLNQAGILVEPGNIDALTTAIRDQYAKRRNFRDMTSTLVAKLDARKNLPAFSALLSR